MTTKRVRVSLYRDVTLLERGDIDLDVPLSATNHEITDLAWQAYEEIDIRWKELETYDIERRDDLTVSDDFNEYAIVEIKPEEAAA